mgnify:CR=1 FL=1
MYSIFATQGLALLHVIQCLQSHVYSLIQTRVGKTLLWKTKHFEFTVFLYNANFSRIGALWENPTP